MRRRAKVVSPVKGPAKTPGNRLGGGWIGCYGSAPERNTVPPWSDATVATSEQERLQIHVRWMIRRDMAEVLEIEQEAFEFPWSDEDFTRCMRQRNCIGMVAEMADSVVAFMIYELHRSRLHVLNFAVRRSHRRLGIGTQMVEKLVGKLTPERRSRIVLEVRERNLPAQLFFRTLGYRAISVLKDFYQDTTEDAYLMQYVLPAAAEEEMPRRLAG